MDAPAPQIAIASRGRGLTMRAMVLSRTGEALRAADLPDPVPAAGQVLLRVQACGVCRTDLHIRDGELTEPKLPLVPGHQVVGTVIGLGGGVEDLAMGAVAGVPWLGWTCGTCGFGRSGRENLCASARFTGYDIDGGYAELCVADARYCLPLPAEWPALQAAPLLCGGLIGFRALRLCGEAPRLGLFGFGSSAHIVAQVARHQDRRIFVFTRPGDAAAQEFARSLGAEWAGDTTQSPPEPLDAAIIFAPAGDLVPTALAVLAPGGTVVCAGIHMSDIPTFAYSLLWQERSIRSVANLTRADGVEFLRVAAQVPVRTEVEVFDLEDAETALGRLRDGDIRGSAVLRISDPASPRDRRGARTPR